MTWKKDNPSMIETAISLQRGGKPMQARCTSLARAMALLGALLLLPGSVVAQISPFLHQGIQELGLSGNLDFQQESRVVVNLNGRVGYFPRNDLEVGGVRPGAGAFH